MTKNLKAVDDNAMNRYEMSMALKNTGGANGKSYTQAQGEAAQNAIKDWSKVPTTPTNYRLSVKYCYALGIITGMSDGTFSGTQNMTRAQACTVIMRMLKLINNYNPGDKDNDQYDDGTSQDNNQASNTLANGKPITEANVLAILAEIQREYPTGTVWDANGTNGNYYANGGKPKTDMADLNAKFIGQSGSKVDLKYACGGWACMVSERIFGQTGFPFREVTNTKDVRPGDVVVFFNNSGRVTHYQIASMGSNPDQWNQFGCCSGNVVGADNIGRVRWDTSCGGVVTKNIRVFTRYPA